jgi:hypothetical protein
MKYSEAITAIKNNYPPVNYTMLREALDLSIQVLTERENPGDISDGYHTFNELYHHRMMLFAVICNSYKNRAWKSWLHHDGTMYNDYFIVGITTELGDYTYHYHKDHWEMFNVQELDKAPEWDGHKPEDITRLLTLLGKE